MWWCGRAGEAGYNCVFGEDQGKWRWRCEAVGACSERGAIRLGVLGTVTAPIRREGAMSREHSTG